MIEIFLQCLHITTKTLNILTQKSLQILLIVCFQKGNEIRKVILFLNFFVRLGLQVRLIGNICLNWFVYTKQEQKGSIQIFSNVKYCMVSISRGHSCVQKNSALSLTRRESSSQVSMTPWRQHPRCQWHRGVKNCELLIRTFSRNWANIEKMQHAK